MKCGSAAYLLFFGVAFYGASPALGCSCEENLTPIGQEDLERFDLIFSGVARTEMRDGQHQCGSSEESEVAWEVETRSVWRGKMARREIVLSIEDSCSPTVSLDAETIFYAARQADGTAMWEGWFAATSRVQTNSRNCSATHRRLTSIRPHQSASRRAPLAGTEVLVSRHS